MPNFVKLKNMKSLDLNAYSVEEMTSQEMKSTNGGWIQF